MENKPVVTLVGRDGNIFSIVGRCARALRSAGEREAAKQMTQRVMASGSYDEALGIILEYVEAR